MSGFILFENISYNFFLLYFITKNARIIFLLFFSDFFSGEKIKNIKMIFFIFFYSHLWLVFFMRKFYFVYDWGFRFPAFLFFHFSKNDTKNALISFRKKDSFKANKGKVIEIFLAC